MATACATPAISSRPRPIQVRLSSWSCSLRVSQTTLKCRASQVPHFAVESLKDAGKQWLKQAISSSNALKDEQTGCTVHLLGVCYFAPQQHRLVATALDELEPTHILIEQPPGSPSDAVLAHPLWMQSMLDHSEDITSVTSSARNGVRNQQNAAASATEPGLHALHQQLSNIGHPEAKVGRDIIDPFETFGFYPGLDLFVNPGAAATTVELCGFLPGQELMVAADYAMVEGAQLLCIDAPLKLQEQWVKQLLDNFKLDEQQINRYKPLRDYNDNQQLLPAAAAEWDKQLAAAAQQLQQAVQQQKQQKPGVPEKSAVGTNAEASVTSAAEQQSLLLYKVSKATAAAMLSPADAQQAMERLKRLQPLKWAHCRLRQRYMAQQIREACNAAAAKLTKGPNATAGKPTVKMLAIIGRQYVPGLQDMWRDPGSSLWSDRVPRTFTPSVVEKQEDYAAAHQRQPSGGNGSKDSSQGSPDSRGAAQGTAAAGAAAGDS